MGRKKGRAGGREERKKDGGKGEKEKEGRKKKKGKREGRQSGKGVGEEGVRPSFHGTVHCWSS